jgi:hypothetical protein
MPAGARRQPGVGREGELRLGGWMTKAECGGRARLGRSGGCARCTCTGLRQPLALPMHFVSVSCRLPSSGTPWRGPHLPTRLHKGEHVHPAPHARHNVLVAVVSRAHHLRGLPQDLDTASAVHGGRAGWAGRQGRHGRRARKAETTDSAGRTGGQTGEQRRNEGAFMRPTGLCPCPSPQALPLHCLSMYGCRRWLRDRLGGPASAPPHRTAPAD